MFVCDCVRETSEKEKKIRESKITMPLHLRSFPLKVIRTTDEICANLIINSVCTPKKKLGQHNSEIIWTEPSTK